MSEVDKHEPQAQPPAAGAGTVRCEGRIIRKNGKVEHFSFVSEVGGAAVEQTKNDTEE